MSDDTPDALEEQLVAASRQPSTAALRRFLAGFLADIGDRDAGEQVRRLRGAALLHDTQFRLHADPLSIADGIGYARAALAAMDRSASGIEQARVWDTLANVLYQQGTVLIDHDALAEAQDAFAHALALVDREADPAAWCTVANSLSSVHASRHRTDGGPEHHEKARALYIAVRALAARKRLVKIWADAAGNVLRMARDEAEGRSDVVALRRITRRVGMVLDVLAARSAAEDASDLRHLLAVTLTMIADRHYDRQVLERARRLWHANLAVWPRERSGPVWAKYTNSIALAEMTIGEKENARPALERALALLDSVADFPSSRHLRPAGAPAPPWTAASNPENYGYALGNAAGVRERLAAMTQSTELLYRTIEDVGDLMRTRSFEDRVIVASLETMLARSTMMLARITHRRDTLAEAERKTLAAAAAFRTLGHDASASIVLAQLGEALQDQAWGPDGRHVLDRAEACLREACAAAGPDEASDVHVSAWRLLALVRLQSASWRGDAAGVAALLGEIEARRARQAADASETQRMLLEVLRVDALSVATRQEDDPAGYARLAQALDVLIARENLPLPEKLGRVVGLGHALHRAGEDDAAIKVWSQAQDALKEAVFASGDLGLAGIATCAAGQTGRDFRAGAGLSLADELAMALLRRNGPGDVERALAAIEAGRAVTPAVLHGADERTLRRRQRLRRLDAAEQDLSAVAFAQDRAGAALGALDRRRRRILQGKASTHARRAAGRIPGLDQAAIIAALPAGGIVGVVVAAERDGAVILLGRDAQGEACIHVVRLDGFDRQLIDHLLLGATPGSAGLLGAIARLQDLDPDGGPSVTSFRAAVDDFSDNVALCAKALEPCLLEPTFAAMRKIFGPAAQRLCWLVPGVLWPVPLHALGRAAPTAPTVQSYGRSLRDVTTQAQATRQPRPSPRHGLLVDNPRGDLVAPSPCADAVAGDPAWQRLGHRRATRAAILRRLRDCDLFLFNGHGLFVTGDRAASGLLVSPDASTRAAQADAGRGLLSIDAIRRLDLRNRGLAVLSACDVGTIDVFAASDAFTGLPTELIDAGFACVIAASWPVEQHATATLMRLLFAELSAAADDPAAALAAAQAAMRVEVLAQLVPGLQRVTPDMAADTVLLKGRAADPSDAFWWAGFRAIGF